MKMTNVPYRSPFELTKDTAELAREGELWGGGY